jgi:hypothetical protein
MAKRLPEVVILGCTILRRERDHDGVPTNEWVDDKNYNTLTRYRDGAYSFHGSPLDHCWDEDGRHETPEKAYEASLKHQLKRLREKCEEECAVIEAELNRHKQATLLQLLHSTDGVAGSAEQEAAILRAVRRNGYTVNTKTIEKLEKQCGGGKHG